jgi:hypothetical protein
MRWLMAAKQLFRDARLCEVGFDAAGRNDLCPFATKRGHNFGAEKSIPAGDDYGASTPERPIGSRCHA